MTDLTGEDSSISESQNMFLRKKKKKRKAIIQ